MTQTQLSGTQTLFRGVPVSGEFTRYMTGDNHQSHEEYDVLARSLMVDQASKQRSNLPFYAEATIGKPTFTGPQNILRKYEGANIHEHRFAMKLVNLAVGAATPDTSFIVQMRLLVADAIGHKLALFLDNLASELGMPVDRTVVSKRHFMSDGKTRIFVRQFISRTPEEVVAYADDISDEIDAWIDGRPINEREYFDDDICMDIYWA